MVLTVCLDTACCIGFHLKLLFFFFAVVLFVLSRLNKVCTNQNKMCRTNDIYNPLIYEDNNPSHGAKLNSPSQIVI